MRDPRPSAALYDLLEEVGASRDPLSAFSSLDRRLRLVLPYDAMALFTPGAERPMPAYASGPEGPPGVEIAAHVAQTRRPAFNCNPHALHRGEVYRAMLAVPLEDESGIIGVMALYSLKPGVFEAADLGVLLWIRAELARLLRGPLAAAAFAGELARMEEALSGAESVPVKQSA